jgi:tetratricopeptide (TPR) repeat protein
MVGSIAAGLLVAFTAPVHAQVVQESRLLREAAALESSGDFDGAEGVLRRLLEANPSSSGGLFALERVLRAKGDARSILSAVDGFLAHEPSSSGVRYLKLRVLVEVDSLEALEEEAQRWFQHEPGSEAPYREVSRVYERAFGPERALDVLRTGRDRVGNEDALALEMGDLLVLIDDVDGALHEWARAVGDDGAQASTVARRVAGLPGDARGAARRLVSILGRADEPGRRRAGASIALEMDLDEEALALVQRAASDLGERERVGFLSDVARRARERDLSAVAAWAYAELGDEARSPGERRQFDQRIVEVALAAGDTAKALEAQHRVVSSYSTGSADRRRATARAIRLEGATADPPRLRELLDEFRAEFPGAPELDDLGATVAAALLARGDPGGAAAVLEGIQGPRSSMQRGYLLLDAGEIEDGRRALLLAVAGLEPSVATEVIQFAGLLGRVSTQGAMVLSKAGVLAHGGRGGAASDLVAASVGELPEADRAPLLAESARMASRGGLAEQAASLNRRVLDEHPDAPEAAEAALSLARYRAAQPDGLQEAISILEDLVIQRPNAAVAPDARRELEKLRKGT